MDRYSTKIPEMKKSGSTIPSVTGSAASSETMNVTSAYPRQQNDADPMTTPMASPGSLVAGTSTPFESVPYFWSDQYDAKLQSLGTAKAQDEMHVVWGSLDEPKWVALLHDGDQLNGVVGLRAPGRVMKLRGLLAAKASYSEALASLS